MLLRSTKEDQMDTPGLGIAPASLDLVRSDDGHGNARLVTTGEVDISNLERLRETVAAILAEPGTTSLVIDVQPLDFIDSTGIQVLLSAMRTAERRGITFSVANAHGKVLRIMTVLNLYDLLSAGGPRAI
jgi:anti-sigma B factor antagonist